MSEIAVIGAGYVGIPTAACFAHLGHHVVCADVDEARVAALSKGEVPILEEGLPALVLEGLQSGGCGSSSARRTRRATPSSCSSACRRRSPTTAPPTSRWSRASPGRSRRCCGRAPSSSTSRRCRSAPPTRSRRALKSAGAVTDVGVASNPEFLREGQAVRDTLAPHRVVIGCDDTEVAVRVSELYRDIQAPVLVTDPASAEMIKYASNAFLATKISFVNAIANLCEAVNADVREVVLGMGYDPRIGFEVLHPGPGFGGSCFPKDTAALLHTADEAGYDFGLLRARDRRQRRAARRRRRQAARRRRRRRCAARTSAIWGLAFKANTDDLRESPAVFVAERLIAEGATHPGVRPRRPRDGRRASPGPRDRDRRVRRGRGRVGARAAHRVGRVPLARLRTGARRRCSRRTRSSTRRNLLDPVGDAPARLRVPGRRSLMPRAVVTGGAGFLGSHLCRALHARGWEVVAVDDLSTGFVANVDGSARRPRLRVRRARRDPRASRSGARCRRCCTSPAPRARRRISIARSRRSRSVRSARSTRSSWRASTTALGSCWPRRARSTAIPTRARNARATGATSTRSARGRSTTRPSASARRSRWRTTACTGSTRRSPRIFNTYGPFLRPEDGRVVSNFLAQAIDGRPLTVYGDGSQTRSFCYVDDLVAGLVALLESAHVGPMNLGNPQRADACSSSRARCSTSPVRRSEIVFEPLPDDDPRQRRPDIALAERGARLAPDGRSPRRSRPHVRLVPGER